MKFKITEWYEGEAPHYVDELDTESGPQLWDADYIHAILADEPVCEWGPCQGVNEAGIVRETLMQRFERITP